MRWITLRWEICGLDCWWELLESIIQLKRAFRLASTKLNITLGFKHKSFCLGLYLRQNPPSSLRLVIPMVQRGLPIDFTCGTWCYSIGYPWQRMFLNWSEWLSIICLSHKTLLRFRPIWGRSTGSSFVLIKFMSYKQTVLAEAPAKLAQANPWKCLGWTLSKELEQLIDFVLHSVLEIAAVKSKSTGILGAKFVEKVVAINQIPSILYLRLLAKVHLPKL